MAIWKITVEGSEFAVTHEEGKIRINDKPLVADISVIGPAEFHVIRNGKGYEAEIIYVNLPEKKLVVRVNGNEYEVEAKDKFDLLLQKMGMQKRAVTGIGNLKAPMPGKVIRVDVGIGESVKQGDSLLILEAMKMENSIKASGEGKVKRIHVKQGDAVEKGTVMIEFE